MSKLTWRDKFLTVQSSFELEYEEAAQLPFAPFHCGAPGKGRYCNRPAGHDGDHMVVDYRWGPNQGQRWAQEVLPDG